MDIGNEQVVGPVTGKSAEAQEYAKEDALVSQSRGYRHFLMAMALTIMTLVSGVGQTVAARQTEPVTVTMWLDAGGGTEGADCTIANVIEPFNATKRDRTGRSHDAGQLL